MDMTTYRLLEETVGIPIEIISNEFNELASNTHHKFVFQIKEEEPDLWAIGVLFTLSLMSFSFSAPRGISEIHFIPDEEWNLEYFVQGLEFENKCLRFSSDYVSGRLMKTDIVFESEKDRLKLKKRNIIKQYIFMIIIISIYNSFSKKY